MPGGGYLFNEWSPATALALYWVDNLIGGVAMAVRIAEHRRLTGAAGHSRAQLGATLTTSSGDGPEKPVKFRSFLAEFLTVNTIFNLAHGVFLAVVLAIIAQPPDLNALKEGAIAIALCHAIAVTIDLFTIQNWQFAALKAQAEKMMGRIILVHAAIIGGTWFMMASDAPDSFFTVFVWLKAFSDIGNLLPRFDSREPPRALVKVMNLFPKQNGESFEDYWRRTRRQEEEGAARDERVERGTKRKR